MEMKHVAKSGLATAYLLTTANDKTAIALIQELTRNALQRLQTEFELSKKAIQSGSDKTKEQHILEVWRDWYVKALATTVDIPVGAAGKGVRAAIEAGQQRIQQQTADDVGRL
jgi:hypothetical protein